ncbi:anti sigma factor C-terminal domain-containing protein [Clostridium sp.]|uniref:anti sigma factor C-terminal domain-containing protein n=1 Tax=Clostridium sp. TaxID=1506 RepID=UPI001A559370|nr:anti sigma factor C-terminal domain-containing protein [Clostridium sp.]MBK5243258.1 anti sigma factor C-terminal domain-containing protein [Clostridium sp.]
MNNEFQEKLQLYKEGKLSQNEMTEIECEIDKFSALTDYLGDDDKAFLEELAQQMPQDHYEENKPAKLLKRKVNLRIILMSAISVCSVLIVIMFLYFTTSKIVTSLFALDYKEAYVKRSTITQLVQMFNPQYEFHGSSGDLSPFAQQNIHVYLDNTVGNALIKETEIKVKFSFGRPVRSEAAFDFSLQPMESSSLLNTDDSNPNPIPDFTILEKAPQGTKAKILIRFNKALTPQQLKVHFINQISTEDTTPLKFTPLAAMDSDYILANPSYYSFTPVYPYGNDNYYKQSESRLLKQTQYDNMDDKAHSESFISNLNLIKSNKRLLQVMYYEDMFENTNIDDTIKQVEINGVKYVGMYISADSKELLKLKGNSLIYGIQVESIVVW